jgi:hypothetical protein
MNIKGNSDHFKISMRSLQLSLIDSLNKTNPLVDKFNINMALELYIPEVKSETPTGPRSRRMRVWADLPLLNFRLSGFKVPNSAFPTKSIKS